MQAESECMQESLDNSATCTDARGSGNLEGVAKKGHAPLTPEQNARVREKISRLREGYSTNKDLAEALTISESQVSRILNGEGTSYPTAQIVAKKLGISPAALLFGEPESQLARGELPATTRWRDVPGFEEALAAARKIVRHPEWVWDEVAEISAPRMPPRVDPGHLVRTADYVAQTLRPSESSRIR